MGLNKGGNAIYVTIFGGKIARRVKTKTADSVTRVNKANKEIHEEYYKSISGKIVGLDKKNHVDYGDSLLVYIKEGTGTYCLQIPLESRYAMNFLKTLPLVDLEKEVEIVPSEKQLADGKKDQTIFIKQGDVAVKRFYKKDDMNGMPEPEVKKKRGKKDEWIWDDVIEFMENEVLYPLRDKLKEMSGFQANTEAPELDEHKPEVGEDGLPF